MMNASAPSLSIVVTPLSGGPLLGSLLAQLTGEGERLDTAEILVVSPDPAQPMSDPSVRWLTVDAGDSVPQRRALGLRSARAKIIAFIDDTIRPRPGWARAVVALHAELVEADAIGGTLWIGPCLSALETTLIALDYGRFLRQGSVSTTSETLPDDNVSFRRDGLERIGAFTMKSFIVADIVRTLSRRLGSVRCESRMAAVCVAANPDALGVQARFQRGRLQAGHRFEGGHHAERIARAATTPLLGALLAGRAWRSLRSLGEESAPSGAWPHLAWMSGVWSVGQAVGYLLGPGDEKQ